MPLIILPLTREDAFEVADLHVESFKNNPFRKIVFPNGMGQASKSKITDNHLKALQDPSKYAMKVVNTDTGEMAACAVWQHTKSMTDEDWDREREIATDAYPDARLDLLSGFLMKGCDAKRRVKKDERWWELISLNVLPKYQRQGIGSMLMEWGNAKQEEMKLPGFIESTDQGYGLYLKHGYREMERWEFDMCEWAEMGGKGTYKNVYLVRELPGGKAPLT